jgi:hypothetical protein
MQPRVIERGVIVGAVPDKQHLDLNIRGACGIFQNQKRAHFPKSKGIIHQVFAWKGASSTGG